MRTKPRLCTEGGNSVGGFERFPCRFPSIVVVQPDTQPTPHTSSRSCSHNKSVGFDSRRSHAACSHKLRRRSASYPCPAEE